MNNGDWRIEYPAYGPHPGARLEWGTTVPTWNITTPAVGDPDSEVADARRARSDGTDFGVDFLGGRTISFDIGVTGASPTVVRTNQARLAQTWRADAVRSRPGAVAALYSRYRDIERVTFGRPRRYTANLSEVTTNRFAQVTADFTTADANWYSADLNSQGIALSAALGGGISFPAKFPLNFGAESDRSVGITVDTDLPAWPVITISGGDITNPVIEVAGLWTLALRTTLAYDETLVIDTQPWARTILKNGTTSLAGALTRSSARLSQASLAAGVYELGFRGGSVSQTPTATVQWRSAHATP